MSCKWRACVETRNMKIFHCSIFIDDILMPPWEGYLYKMCTSLYISLLLLFIASGDASLAKLGFLLLFVVGGWFIFLRISCCRSSYKLIFPTYNCAANHFLWWNIANQFSNAPAKWEYRRPRRINCKCYKGKFSNGEFENFSDLGSELYILDQLIPSMLITNIIRLSITRLDQSSSLKIN